MSSRFSRRLFLKSGALAASALAVGAFPRMDGFCAAPEARATVFFTRDLSAKGLLKIYERINGGLTGNIAVKLHTGEPLSLIHISEPTRL